MLFDRKRFHNNLQKRKKESLELLFWIGTCVFFIAVFTSALFLQNSVQTASPPTILTYQGKLLNAGDSVTSTQSITFTIHDNLTGGSILYAASGTTAVPLSLSITPSSGIFAVNLGATSTNSIDPTIFQNYSDLYLEVAVDTTTLTPRKRITSVPFSINSKYLSGVAATSTASTTTYIPVSASDGSFTFNTTTFNKDLTVDSGIFYVDSLNDRVGLNTTTPNADYFFTVSGTTYIDATTTISDLLTVEGKIRKPTFQGSIAAAGGSIFLNGPEAVFVQGNYAYVTASVDGAIQIIDVSDPVNPTALGSLTHGTNGAELDGAQGIFVAGDIAYVTAQGGDSDALEIIDISNPSSPKHLAAITSTTEPLLDSPFDVFVQGNYAYVVNKVGDSLVVIDVSIPTNPQVVGTLVDGGGSAPFLNGPQSIHVVGNYAYIAENNGDALEIVDISDPKNPVHAGVLLDGTGGAQINSPQDVFVLNSYAYIVSQADDNLQIVDVSDPQNPSHVTSTIISSFQNPTSVVVGGDYAYISATTQDSVSILDISSTTNPVLVGSIKHGDSGMQLFEPRLMTLVGNHLYVPADSSDTLSIIDVAGAKISNAEIGTAQVNNISVDGTANFGQSLNIRGGLNAGAGALFGGDVFLSSASSTLTSTNTLGFSHRALFSASSTNGYVFSLQSKTLLADTNVLFRLQNSSTDKFTVLGNGYIGVGGTTTPNHALAVSGTTFIDGATTIANNLTVDGGTLYVDATNNVVAVNTTTPSTNFDFVVSGTSYLAGTTTVTNLLDVRGKSVEPTHAGAIAHGAGATALEGASSVAISGDFAYVSSLTSDSITVVDISNPQNPTEVAVVNDGDGGASLNGPGGIKIAGRYAYVTLAVDNGLQILDINDPKNPVHVSTLLNGDQGADFTGAVDISIAGNIAIVTTQTTGTIVLLDISDPYNVVVKDQVTVADGFLTHVALDVTIVGDFAYVSSFFNDRLNIFDISDEETLRFVSSISQTDLNGIADTVIRGKYGYVASVVDNSFNIIDVTNVNSTTHISKLENGDQGFTMLGPGKIVVSGDYAYVSAGLSDSILVVDISNPLSPKFVSEIKHGDGGAELDNPQQLVMHGNYLYVASVGVDSNALEIIDVSGAKIVSAEIGSLITGQLVSSFDAVFQEEVNIRGGLSVGADSLFNGNIALSAASSTLTSTNTLSFSHRAIFSASSTNGYAFNLQTRNVLTDTDVLFRLQNSSTDKFTVLGNGYVGIGGTTTPNHALSVSGTAFIDGAVTLSNNLNVGGGVLYVDALLNVAGVNTSTPLSGYNFVVSGTSFFSGTTTIKEKLSVEGYANQPRHLNQFSSGSITNGIQTMELRGDYAYIGADSASAIFSILDISNPHIPKVLGSVVNSSKMEGITDIALKGNYAYIAASSIDALTVVNIASNTPFVVNDFYTGSITGINAIDIQGQYLYATGPTDDAINIFDISNPEAPLFVSSITNGGASAPFLDNPQDIKVRGDYAYVASWDSNRVQVLDISDPENPIAASSITTGAGQPLLGLTKSITISGNYLFVTAESSPAMNILDISDPTNISAVGTFFDASLTWGGPVDVEVAGDYAYVSSATSDKIVVIDISDPSNPSLKGTINDGQDGAALNQPTDIEIHGNYLYVASASSNKLEILDIGGALISTAEIGVLDVDAINVNGRAHFDNKLTIRGGVEVANSISLMDGLFFNSAPSSTLSSTNTLSFSHRSLFSASSTNGYVFNFQSRNVLSDSAVLFRLQNSSTDKFTVLGNGYVGIAGTSTAEHALAVSGTSYISGTTTITNLLDVKGKILQPRFVNEISSTTGALLENPDGVFVSGDYAYVASAASDALSIIDVSNPEETIGQVGSIQKGAFDNFLDGASEVFVSGDFAYVASLVSDSLDIFNVSQPSSPTHAASILDGEQGALLNGAESVFVQGNYAYVGASASNAMTIVDITDPYNPSVVSTISNAGTLAGIEDVFVSGNYAYLAASLASRLVIVDISDPKNPSEEGSVSGLTAANDIFVQGDFAYVTENASSQVSIVDVLVPSAPTIVGVISNGDGGAALSSPNRIFVSGDYAYVTSKVSDALEIIDISSSTNPVHVSKMAHGEGGAELDSPSGVYIRGNYAYVAADGGLSDALNVIDISGTRISNAEIGNVNVSALQVGTVARFNQDVHIRGGINTGGNSLFSGDLSITAATSSLTATSTVGFSHRAYFHSSSTDGYNFIFDTTNALASSSLPIFSVRNAGTPLLSLHANGNLRLDGNIYASSTVIGTPGSPGDLAEQVDVDPNEVIEPGDVLCVDPEAHDRYRKCRGQNAQDVAGVVSTNATIITGFGKTNTTAIMALVGRVPIKVTLENGPINRGDLLITASTTGYAMKYDPSKDTGSANISIIGLALDSYTENSSSTGKILGLVKSGWVQNQTQTIAQLQQDLDDIAENQGHNVNDNLQQLDIIEDNGQLHNLDTNLNLNNNYIINVAGIFGSNNAWKVDNNGRFVTNIETGNGTEETLYAVQSRDTEFVFSGSDALVDGERRITFNLDTKLLIDNTKPIKVSITLTDEANGVFVTSKDETGFTVKELANGESNATFDWVVIASRILAEDVEQNEPEEEPEQEDPVEEPLEEEQPPVEDEEQNEEQENQPPEENNEAPPEENPNPEQEEPPVEEPEQEEQNPEPPVEEPPVEEEREPEQNEPEPDPVDDPPPQPEPPLEEPPEEAPPEVPEQPEENPEPPPEDEPLPEPEQQT